MATSLRSNQWSCSELVKGAALCADMAGMELRVNPNTLSRDELLQSIKEAKALMNNQQASAPKFLVPKEEIPDTVPAVVWQAQEEIDAMFAQPVDSSKAAIESGIAAPMSNSDPGSVPSMAESMADKDMRDDGTDPIPLKRPERPVTEKVSPEKKLPKMNSTAPAPPSDTNIGPKALNFDGEGKGESTSGSAGHISPPPPGLALSQPGVSLDSAAVAALLQRISDLEAQVKSKPQPPQDSLTTPPVKAKSVESPPSASTTATASSGTCQDKTAEDSEDKVQDTENGDLLVMPSGNAVEFAARVVVVRERMETKEKESTGMSAAEIRSIIAYCSRFPQALVHPWKYDPNVKEYFVETETKQTIRQSEMRKQTEISDRGDQEHQEPIDAPAELALADETGHSPEPEKMGDKALPDLQKFMDSIHGRIMQCHKLSQAVETDAGETPAGKELIKDFKRITDQLATSFRALAELKAELLLNEEAESTDELKDRIAKVKATAKKPCADLIAIEPRQKLLLADFKKSGKTDKNAATSADGVEAAAKPKAKPKAKGKSKSQKEAQA